MMYDVLLIHGGAVFLPHMIRRRSICIRVEWSVDLAPDRILYPYPMLHRTGHSVPQSTVRSTVRPNLKLYNGR